MKRIFTMLTATLLSFSLFAQLPQKMSYQAVIRDANDRLVKNQIIGMQISILQGSSSGTAVYTETHATSTNANGLVSVEIGEGASSDDFTGIDWANGPFFLMSETQLAGETNFTITATSQLMSVPYALHAKTAETLSDPIVESDPVYAGSQAANITSGDISNLRNQSGVNTGDQDLSGFLSSETDPVFAGSQAANITSGDISNLRNQSGVNTGDQDLSGFLTGESDPLYTSSEAATITAADMVNLQNLSGTNTGDQDGSETIVTGGINVTVSGTGTTANPYVINSASGGSVAAIGDSYGGGIIFWLDASGKHGLIAASSDQSTGIQWYNGSYTNTGAILDAVYAGKANTDRIIANQGTGSYAAQLCADYSVTVNNEYYDDWYLPSRYELNLLYLQKDAVGGFDVASYWSSTEADSNDAHLQGFNSAIQFTISKDGE